METAQIVDDGYNQVMYLPPRIGAISGDFFVQKVGKMILLVPQEDAWQTFLEGINGFTDDFMADGRESAIPSPRDTL